jgi:hypothetical protein
VSYAWPILSTITFLPLVASARDRSHGTARAVILTANDARAHPILYEAPAPRSAGNDAGRNRGQNNESTLCHCEGKKVRHTNHRCCRSPSHAQNRAPHSSRALAYLTMAPSVRHSSCVNTSPDQQSSCNEPGQHAASRNSISHCTLPEKQFTDCTSV